MARRQLLEGGIGPDAIKERTRSGLLVVLHRGVYCLGKPTARSFLRAALLATGNGAVLSHASAAWVLGLEEEAPPVVHVTTSSHVRGRKGITVHCVRSLPAEEVTSRTGFPCTTVARTLVDLAATNPRRRVERALDQAERLNIWDEAEPRRTRPGSARLNAVLAEHTPGTTITRSALEEAFLELCRRGDIPQPALNAPLVLPTGRKIVVDALWRAERVAVELDGRAAHLRRRTFESDRARDVELTVAGYLPARFTWLQVTREPEWVVRQVLGLLSRRLRPAGS